MLKFPRGIISAAPAQLSLEPEMFCRGKKQEQTIQTVLPQREEPLPMIQWPLTCESGTPKETQ